jgi:transcriptional regulator with XRE-family HTH domain
LYEPRKPRDAREAEQRRFGETLRSARRAAGLSQAALAKAIGISPVFISQIETGQRVPSDRITKAIATRLGLPWQELIRTVYRLRSSEAEDLFATDTADECSNVVAEIPSIRLLLLQLASLNLSKADVETLVRNWSNDLTLISHLSKAQDA